jgi:hypothetical protein
MWVYQKLYNSSPTHSGACWQPFTCEERTMWIYQRTEHSMWTTGSYGPDGNWMPDCDFDTKEEAARRCNWLNGGTGQPQWLPTDRWGQPLPPPGE